MGDVAIDDYRAQVDEVSAQVITMEQKVHEIEQFYLNNNKKQMNNSKGRSTSKDKDKDKERHVVTLKKQQHDATSSQETDASKRMQELIREFNATIMRQMTQHKWAWAFMEPVDVKGLGLHDYYEIIDTPMDFKTIRNRIEGKDGGYKHVREICADVRLVFKNAMKYNDEKNDFHVMAKSMLAKFEEKWLQFLPMVVEEEKRREEEETEADHNTQITQEAAYSKMARELGNELFEAEMHLEDLRDKLVLKCRKFSTEEKRQLGTALARLSHEDLIRAVEIVAQANSEFVANTEEVDLDLDAQTESTLWRLKLFAKDALLAQAKAAAEATTGGNKTNDNDDVKHNKNNSKRKREICDALVKTAKKRSKKSGS